MTLSNYARAGINSKQSTTLYRFNMLESMPPTSSPSSNSKVSTRPQKTDTINSFNLPEDVFDVGEQKPQKKAAGTKGPTNGKKRGAPEVGV
jgi:hypothetical protein